MMMPFLLIFPFFFVQDIPLKPTHEFEIRLDYNFRPRPVADNNTVHLGETSREFSRRTSQGVLPYLVLYVKPLALREEKMRIRISSNDGGKLTMRKAILNSEVELDLGFTDDMKDRVTSHEYTLTFLSEDKEPVDKIVISVAEDGSFLVNGELRGKF
ncbi:MAG TPA: hypothetical protein VF490_00810 [Chryseosolibacter sp.]